MTFVTDELWDKARRRPTNWSVIEKNTWKAATPYCSFTFAPPKPSFLEVVTHILEAKDLYFFRVPHGNDRPNLGLAGPATKVERMCRHRRFVPSQARSEGSFFDSQTRRAQTPKAVVDTAARLASWWLTWVGAEGATALAVVVAAITASGKSVDLALKLLESSSWRPLVIAA